MNKEQLIQMDASDYMNDQQVAFFKELLESMQAEAVAGLRDARESLGTLDKPADPADSATVEETRLEVGRLIERLGSRLRDIATALEALRAGDYGYCADYGNEIGLKRLLLQPTALLCVEAQSTREQKNRHLAS